MNNTYFLDQIQKTGDLTVDLIMRQYKLDKMVKFKEIKSNKTKLKQSEIANLLESSFSTIQRYRNKIHMLSLYRIPSSSKTNNTRKQNRANTNLDDVKVTSNDLKRTSNDLKTTSNNDPVKPKKNNLKGGGNIEINEIFLDEIIHINFLQMDLAVEFISNDKTLRNAIMADLKEFNNQSLASQAKKGEQLVYIMPANKKAFSLLGDDIIELSSENDALKDKIGSYDENWLQESKTKLLKHIDDKKRAILVMSRKKKQMNKQY